MDLKCSACKTLVFDERKQKTKGYRCIQCEDFVLCSDCERLTYERHFATHVFIVFNKEHADKKVKDFPLADKEKVTVNMGSKHPHNCTVCGLPTIVGVMYSCTHCADFHVCSEDYETNPKVANHNLDHSFMKIPTIFAPLNEIIWDLDANSTWFKGKEEKDFLFDTNAMLKQLNDKKKTPAKTTTSGDSKTPKPMIDKQSNARYLDGLTTTQTPTVNSQYTEEGAKNTGAVTSHYTEAFTPVNSPQAPHSQYTNELGTTSQYVDETARTGASEMIKGNIVSSGYTDGAVTAKPIATSGYTDSLSENKAVTTSGYTDGLAEDKPLAISGYTDESPASPNAARLSRYILTGNDSVPPLVNSSGDLSMSNGSSLYSGTLEYPATPSVEVPKEKLKEEPKHEEKVEVSSPKERKHKEHKHKKEDSKSGMKRSKSERTDEKIKKEKKSKKRSRSNSHGHKNDHTLALSAPTTPVKEETISVEAAPDTCPKRKEKESKVTRDKRSSSMPEKKFKIALRKSHKSKSKLDDHKTTQSAEVIVHPVLVEPSVPTSTEISPKSPRKDKSSRKSPKADRPVSVPVQPKKDDDLKAIAEFYIETGLQAEKAESKQKDKKHKEKREKKKEKKSKRPKSSRSNTATSTELVHATTAPELGRYTSADELFEINRRLVEGETSPKTSPSPANVNATSLSSSGSAQHNYVSHVDTNSSVQEPAKDQKANVPGTSYAANYLTSPPTAAVNYIANPNADPGVDVESDSEEHGPETELGYQTAINRKMYAATSYSNYGASDDIIDLNENAYAGQPIDEDFETAFESKPISKVQGPISLSKMALRPQATDMAQSSGSGINWGDAYMGVLRDMVGTKDRMMKVMRGEKVVVTPEMRSQVLNFRQHVQEFRAAASNIAKRIIDEAFLPLHQKTIKPVDVGGIAGGQKYVYDGIFLKFAIDLFGVYGGDYAAAKAANRELQGLKGYYEAMIPGLMVPPMLLIDYRGFRMVATPCLPISKDTLEYGSADGGLTVLKKSKDLNRKMKLAATKMKLKGHIVGTNSPTQIYGPADIEGHKTFDGLHFVIDTARVSPPFPPEKTISAIFLPQDPVTTNPWIRYGEGTKLLDVPIKNLKNNLRQYFPHLPAHAQLEESNMPGATIYHVPEQYLKERVLNRIATSAVHKLIYGDVVLIYTLRLRGTQLYDLLRLELLQHPDVPALSSDAFTFFQQAGIEKDNDEADVRKAVRTLQDKIIPEFCDDLLNKRINVWSSPTALVDEMHKRGINIKFLGDIRTRVISDAKLDSIVTIEMVARASKYFLRSQLRRIKSREIKQDEIKVILGNFNMVIGDSIASRYYWQFIIRALVTAKFGPSFCDVEKNDLDFDLRSAICDKYALFTALEAHTGIKFTPEIHEKLRSDPALFDKKIVVRASDFDSLEARHRTWGDECIQKKLDRITAALNEAIEMTKESNTVLEEEGQKLHVEVPVV